MEPEILGKSVMVFSGHQYHINVSVDKAALDGQIFKAAFTQCFFSDCDCVFKMGYMRVIEMFTLYFFWYE